MEQPVSFGAYRFEVGTARLWCGAQEIRLTPKASAVLKELVTQAGTPVSKDDLFATVWSGTAVTDDALTSCIQELRRAFDDDARKPRFIETRHRRGYRFVARLSEAAAEGDAAPSPVPAVAAIAVLPFADMSPGRDQGYLCDGLAEEVINVLTQVEGLSVTARTASFQFRGAVPDLRAVGRHLAAGYLLAGSLRKVNDRLRVTVQLIDVATGYQRWSQRFDRTVDDVFAIQDEIAQLVAASLERIIFGRCQSVAVWRPQTGAGYGVPCADGTTASARPGGTWRDASRWPRAT